MGISGNDIGDIRLPSDSVVNAHTTNYPLHPRTQVYLATHDGGDNRLPLFERAFISFTWGGRAIEDFGVISVSNGSRYERNVYGQFEDSTTKYEVIDGQLFWGSHFTNNEMTFNLVTDGMLESQYLDFKSYFRPGMCRELILAEHPNRYIMARISEVPTFNTVPFKETIIINVGSLDANTPRQKEAIITKYKGEITLKFVMDDPFWKSKLSIIDSFEQKYADDSFSIVETINDDDYLKIIAEDNIPHVEMIDFRTNDSLILANGYYVASVNEPFQHIGGRVASDDPSIIIPDSLAADEDSVIEENEATAAFITSGLTTNGFTIGRGIGNGTSKFNYLYYAGNAPSEITKLKFSLKPALNSRDINYYDWNKMIRQPANEYIPEATYVINYDTNPPTFSNPGGGGVPYSSFWIKDKRFDFTLPSFFYSYNKAISIFKTAERKSSVDASGAISNLIELQEKIRLEVPHYIIKKWALNCLDLANKKQNAYRKTYNTDNGVILRYTLCNLMCMILSTHGPKITEIDNNEYYFFDTQYTHKQTFEFNFKTGEAYGTFKYNKWPLASNVTLENYDDNPCYALMCTLYDINPTALINPEELIENDDENDAAAAIIPADPQEYEVKSEYILSLDNENIGDMIVSFNLTIDELTTGGRENNGMIDPTKCLIVATDFPVGTLQGATHEGLTDIQIEYDNIYY